MVRFPHVTTWPITVKVPLLVAGLMIGVAGLISQVVLTRLIQDQEANLALLTDAYLDGLTAVVLPGVLRADVWEAFDALDRARARYTGLDVRYAIVETADGAVLAASDPIRFPAHSFIPGELKERFPAGNGIAIDSGIGHAWLARSLQEEGFSIGRILAEIDITDLLRVRREVLWTLILANGGLTIAFTAFGYVTLKRMLQPLAVLSRHVERVRDGRVEPIPERYRKKLSSEFGQLFDRFNAMARSLSERETLASHLAEQEKYASLGKLASGLAHEVNNPLGGMLNTIDTLRKHGETADVRRRALDLLERGLKGIGNVVRAALVTYKSGERTAPLSRNDIDDLRYLIQHETIRRRIHLEWRNELPEITNVDGGATRQIALNLLLNACAATAVGGMVRVHAFEANDKVSIVIADQGPGLPPDMAALLARATPGAPNAAIGLGLWTASRLLVRINGHVEIDCGPEVGTTLTIAIPVAASEVLHAVA